MLPLTTMKPMALVIAVPVLNLVEYHPERGDTSSLFVETTYMHHHSESPR